METDRLHKKLKEINISPSQSICNLSIYFVLLYILFGQQTHIKQSTIFPFPLYQHIYG